MKSSTIQSVLGLGLLIALAIPARAAVRFDVVGSPTEVIGTGRSEVLGAISMVVSGTGNVTGTALGGTTQIGIILTQPALSIDNTTASGIKLVTSGGFTAAAASIVSVENRDLNGQCTGFITVNIPGGFPVAGGDFIRLEGIRGRIDASRALTPGTDLFADLQSVNDPAANTFSPDRLRLAKSFKGMTATVVTTAVTYEIRITEGFARAFVDMDAANEGVHVNDRTDSTAAVLGAPTNSTQFNLRMEGIPDGVTDVEWPIYSSAATTGARLYLISESFTGGSTAANTTGTAAAVYSFETPNQVASSDTIFETFAIAPSFVLTSGRCNTDLLTTSVTLGPAVTNATGCGEPAAGGARPRFLEMTELQLTSLQPETVVAGSPDLSLTLRGNGFVAGSKVLWNGSERATTFVSSSELRVTIPAGDLVAPARVSVAVQSAVGGFQSNERTLIIESPALTLVYPRLVSGAAAGFSSSTEGEVTGIALANPTGRTATLKLSAFDTSGALIAGPGITNPVTLELAGGRQTAQVDTQIFGTGFAAVNPVGWIKVEGDVPQVAGFFLAFDAALSHLDGADVSSDRLTSLVLTEVEAGGVNQIHVANPALEAASVTFELVGSDGAPRAEPVTREIKANGAVADTLAGLFPGIEVAAGDYVRLRSTRGVAAFEYLGSAVADAQGLNGQDALGGAKTLYAPQFVAGGSDWSSQLSIVNLEQTAGSVTFRFIADDGAQIGSTRTVVLAAGGKIRITDPKFFLDAGDTLRQGYVEIASSGPRLAGSVVFRRALGRGFATALPLVSRLDSDMLFSQVASDETYFTGVSLLNPGDTQANAIVQVFDRDGNSIAIRNVPIPAKGRVSKLLTEYFPELSGEALRSGYISVRTNRNVAGFALFGATDLSVLSAVPAQIVP